ncbi:MAG TPA: thioesterase family protein [Acidimicrobiia bacterium]|nr:thioesterase family protein [Acidimicrobiia bacterium]
MARADSKFVRETAVVADRARPGRYHAFLSPDWNAPMLPQGGIVTVVATRAMEARLAHPEQQLRSVSVVFAGQVRAGSVQIDVGVIRRGRSISQLTATVRNPGEAAGTTAIAVFGASRPGFEFTDRSMPDAPPPEECRSFRTAADPAEDPDNLDLRFHFPYWDFVDGRSVEGHAPWEEHEPTSSERSSWYRFDEAPRLADGHLDPHGLVTLCDTMPGAVGERVGERGDRPVWLSPSADLHVQILGEWRSEWLLAHNSARRAGDGYAALEMELWDPESGLVAYGTQLMFFSFPDGPPTPDQLHVPNAHG